MVSVVLLTTEEVLNRNGFWYCLDSIWVTEEMEPFEDIKPQDLFTKPLSRDFYYAKFPEIPRSESEDENPIGLNGFKLKHREWKSKVNVKRFYAQRRNSTNSNGSVSSVNFSANSDRSRRLTSSVELTRTQQVNEDLTGDSSDDEISDYFQPVNNNSEKTATETNNSNCSLMNSITIPKQHKDLNEIDLPDYVDFEKNKMPVGNQNSTNTSTLKKSKRRVSFNLDTFTDEFDHRESWCESIFGLSKLYHDVENDSNNRTEEYIKMRNSSVSSSDEFFSWSDIIDVCGMGNSLLRSKESLNPSEELITRSHCYQDKMIELPLVEESDGNDDEIGYARFAIYKLHQTLKISGRMADSSSLENLNYEEDRTKHLLSNKSFLENRYYITPNITDLRN